MSTILKALEKVEEEERLGRTPGEAAPGPPPGSAAPTEPAPQEERRLPWRGALVGAAVVTFTLGLVWLWTPEQAEKEVAQALPTEAQAAIRPAAEPTETAAVSSMRAALISGDSAELADSIATRLTAAVPDEPSASSISPPPAAEPPRGQVAPPAAEPPPLAVAAEIQPTAEGPVASLPAALPADPPPVQPDPTPVAPPPAANVASAPPQARVEPSPKATPPTARPEPAPKPPPQLAPKAPPAKPRPTRVVTIPPAPTVHVARTVWHPNPDRRSARVEVEGFVEPLELKEGDAVGVLVVAEIQPSAVVFLHGGARLRHPVGK